MSQLKGKNTFTVSEIKKLEELITLRNNSPASKQKNIRQKMRNLGFYGKDDWGITDLQVEDLRRLITSGQIKVIGGSDSFPKNTTKEKMAFNTPKPIQPASPSQPAEIKDLLAQLKANTFDPQKDNKENISDSPGNYIICLKKGARLPVVSLEPEFNLFQEFKVIYTGISGNSLRNRDYKQHFIGNNAGRSTLRKSLGALFGYKQIPRDKNPNSTKTKFTETDEVKLTDWMKENLLMFFYPTSRYNEVENLVINHFNPPLNLSKNKNITNKDYRSLLSKLRTLKR